MSESASEEFADRSREGADTSEAHSSARDEYPTEVFGAVQEPSSDAESSTPEVAGTGHDAADEWEQAFRGAGSDTESPATSLPRRTPGARLASSRSGAIPFAAESDAQAGSSGSRSYPGDRDSVIDWFGSAADADADSTMVIPRITDDTEHPGAADTEVYSDEAGADDTDHDGGDVPEGDAESGIDAESVQDAGPPEPDELAAERTELIPVYRDDEDHADAEGQSEDSHQPEPEPEAEAEAEAEAEGETEAEGEADQAHAVQEIGDRPDGSARGEEKSPAPSPDTGTAAAGDTSGERDLAAAGKAGAAMSRLYVEDEPEGPAGPEAPAEPQSRESGAQERPSQKVGVQKPGAPDRPSRERPPQEPQPAESEEPQAESRPLPVRRPRGARSEPPEAAGEATEVIKAFRDDESPGRETTPIDRRQLSAKIAENPVRDRRPAPKAAPRDDQPAPSANENKPAESPNNLKRWLLVIALLLLAAVAAAVAVFFQGKADAAALADSSNNMAMVDKVGTATLDSQTREAIQAIFSYDTAQLAASEKRGRSYIAPGSRYLGEFQQTYGRIREFAAKGRAILKSTIADSGVERLSGNSGKVLLMVNQVGRSGVNGPPINVSVRLSVTTEKVGGTWKVSDVETD